MSNLAWKFNRLRAMGAGEIAYRVRHAAQAQWEQCGFGLAKPPVPRGECGRIWREEPPRGFKVEVYSAAAERVLAGYFDVFAMKGAVLGFPPDWNQDPKTGTVAPLVFGKTLNYRNAGIVGDIKYLWEPNRHAELVTLAQAWHLTGKEKYAEGCRTFLESWFDQCPYPLGVNWTSSLEHGVRLANWAVTWHLLGDRIDAEFRHNWLNAIYQHCHFIAGHFSRHSSANNHLLGELMGLFIGSTMWPLWPESSRWLERAIWEFEAEAIKQTAPDGVNREQAVWYQHEVADMMLLVGLVGLANGVEFSETYWRRLEAMLEFIAVLMDVGGNVPMIGDADDARLVRFDPRLDANVYRSLLATGAVLFMRNDFKEKAGNFDDKSRWLLSDAAELTFASLEVPAQEALRRNFALGGYTILGDAFGTAQEIRIVVDTGPLGYLSIAAHGHADALALTLSIAGHELLIDPGTYAYHTERKWRGYFKGTSAHNTVRVDGLDQSVSGGSFMWLKHAKAKCEHFLLSPERDCVIGSHAGYVRLKDPVAHMRRIELSKISKSIEVFDDITCKATHLVEIFWHFAECCIVTITEQTVFIMSDGIQLQMTMPESKMFPQLFQGNEALPMGWISRHFDVRVPSPTVVWQGEITGSCQFRTVLQYQFNL